jgi:hypothetical protein
MGDRWLWFVGALIWALIIGDLIAVAIRDQRFNRKRRSDDMRRLVLRLLSDAPNGATETMLRSHGVDIPTLEAMLAQGELRATVDTYARLPGRPTERRFRLVAIRKRNGALEAI